VDIRRVLLHELKGHLEKPEITLLTGPRQSGKTTLLMSLREMLVRRGQPSIFLNLDLERDAAHFASQDQLLEKINLEFGGQKGFVFIDEIQRKENAGLFLKGIYDMRGPHKWIVSGSGSLELKGKIQESLAGRKRMFTLDTCTFLEYAAFQTQYRYGDRLYDWMETEPERARHLLEQYVNYGGYPRVVLEASDQEKRLLIDEIFSSYLEKDVAYLLNVDKTEAYGRLVRLLSIRVGTVVRYSELAARVGISVPTVKQYLWYLERTFIIDKVTPFARNREKEITKAPVYYFRDLGMRSYAAGETGAVTLGRSWGFCFQNFIYNLLTVRYRYFPTSIHFWRTKDKAEVDFVLVTGGDAIPIEVKTGINKVGTVSRSMRSFIRQYTPREAYVITPSAEGETEANGVLVRWISYFRLDRLMPWLHDVYGNP
jgi:hypothetical protein